jgi:transposase
MPFVSGKAKLVMSPEVHQKLTLISRSRTEAAQKIERAKILLEYESGQSISAIARNLKTNRPKIERCINKALQLGVEVSLVDLAGRGKPPAITPEARAWLLSLACQKPTELGYSYELWTTRLLAQHVQQHCMEVGHPSLLKIGRGTISKILSKGQVRPHKVRYYLEKRDPEFDTKMAQVLYVYKEVEIMQSKEESDRPLVAILSYDEKPGIQAIENTSPDLPPVPGRYPAIARDHEYVRHGTLSLMAGIDLLNGHVLALVAERHRSYEFIEFLKEVDKYYSDQIKIRIVLDNHSAHISKETQSYLSKKPNRFEFIFTPKHGSWLNLIETFFSKMARTFLREIRVSGKTELVERITKYIAEVNEQPVIFHWKYGLDSITVA